MNTWKRGLGIGLIFAGLFIVLTGKAITGAVIGFGAENYLSLLGILVFIVGVFLALDTKLRPPFRSRSSLRGTNREAEHYMRLIFEDDKRYKPSSKELKDFMRANHERIGGMVDDYKQDKGYKHN